jgi:hypothetical protein
MNIFREYILVKSVDELHVAVYHCSRCVAEKRQRGTMTLTLQEA